MEMAVETIDGVTVVELHGEYLDASIAEEFKRDIAPVLEEANSKVVFDMSQLQFVDSAGIGAILSCRRRLSAAGGDLKLCAVSKPVRGAFEITRMHRLFDIFDTQEEAIRSFA
jgi:anti-sigma B factor antagonist